MDKASELVTGYVLRKGTENTHISADLDADSGVLTFQSEGSPITHGEPKTVRFVEVETLLSALSHLEFNPGVNRFGTDSFREYWRTVLTEKLDAREL